MKIKQLLWVSVWLCASCSAPRLAYFQDLVQEQEEMIANDLDIRIKHGDRISIIVKSKDPMLSNLFNLPIVTQRIGQVGKYDTYPQGVAAYTVDSEGNIDFPVLGKIYIFGQNREEIAGTVKNLLISNDLVKDPVVTVEFVNLTVSVLGEVNRPGRFSIDRDRLTLLDAIAMAGDLTVSGRRDNVLVQRNGLNGPKIYRVDLSSGRDLCASPVYYLQQNDVVYIEPNAYKTKDATVNNKALRWSSFWLSCASIISSVTMTTITAVNALTSGD